MTLTKTQELIVSQTKEIERLRFALSGCLNLSKQTSPYLYSAALASVQIEAHIALYGDIKPIEAIKRPIATYMRIDDAELTQEEALQNGD